MRLTFTRTESIKVRMCDRFFCVTRAWKDYNWSRKSQLVKPVCETTAT